MSKPRNKPNYRREDSGYRTWAIVKWQFSTASDPQLRVESTSTPSISSLPGAASSLGWPSTASSSCAIACTRNRRIPPRIRIILA